MTSSTRPPGDARGSARPASPIPGGPALLSALLLVTALGACEPRVPEDGPEDAATAGGGNAPAASAPADSSLLSIMLGLEEDMERLHQALWREDLEAVEAAARAVAEHPRVTAEERGEISSILGEDMPAFAAHDTRVHEASVALAEAAAAADTAGVLDALDRLGEGCVACHTAFRERIRAGRP